MTQDKKDDFAATEAAIDMALDTAEEGMQALANMLATRIFHIAEVNAVIDNDEHSAERRIAELKMMPRRHTYGDLEEVKTALQKALGATTNDERH